VRYGYVPVLTSGGLLSAGTGGSCLDAKSWEDRRSLYAKFPLSGYHSSCTISQPIGKPLIEEGEICD